VARVVKPIVRLFFPCEDATLDLEDESWTLKNPLHTISLPPGATGVKELWLYAQLTEGVGTFNLSVEMRTEEGIRIGKGSPPSSRSFPGGVAVVEEVFHLVNVPFARPGLYEFVLLANHAELEGGKSYLRVELLESTP
jgi:hypothetical protein